MKKTAIAFAAVALLAGPAAAQEGPSLTVGGTTYTKWLYGTQREQGAMYNFTTVPGEGYGDNGQGTELELLLKGKLSRQVEINARLHSRFNQNFWTNYGGFGGTNPPTNCVAGNCGEYDPRSNQYVKLRGVQVILTPGYQWIDSATIGSNDFGMFDPFVIGRIRYIDRDNAQGLLFQGSAMGRKLTWDLTRISLPRLWAGPNYTTGTWHASDAVYGGQLKIAPTAQWDLALIASYVNDQEIDAAKAAFVNDHGTPFSQRFKNYVHGARASFRPIPGLDLRGQFYQSFSHAYTPYAAADYGGINGYGPIVLGSQHDWSGKLNATLVEPLHVAGLTVNLEIFSIGKNYVAMMAARRESDVLLTEGHDAAFAFPGPSNASYGVFGGNKTRIGYGGWSGNAQQVATVNVDNEFTDFDEPMAETAIGWKGVTLVPTWNVGPLEIAAEYSYIGYNTNWQAWGHPELPLSQTVYPGTELDSGVGHNFRSAYAPFQDKWTQIALVKAKYTLDFAKGVDVFGKVKFIKEVDKRMNDARFLPYTGTYGTAGRAVNNYSAGNSTSSIYGDPGLVTEGGITGPQWKPFDSISDDDRDLSYWAFSLGAGYQFFDELYLSLSYIKYLADLKDGNTAFQAYQLHEMASGKHDKNQFVLKARYILAGIEFGMEGQYNFGTFKPNFGTQCTATGQVDCYVPTVATATTGNGFPAGSRGFAGRFGGWNSLEERTFENWRLKAFMKAQF
jgi:hypothetical protein